MYLQFSRTGELWTSVQELDWCKFQNSKFGYFTDKIKSPVDLNTITRLRLHPGWCNIWFSHIVSFNGNTDISPLCFIYKSGTNTLQMLYVVLIPVLLLLAADSHVISKHLLPIIPCCTVPLWNWFYSRDTVTFSEAGAMVIFASWRMTDSYRLILGKHLFLVKF